MQKRDGIPFLLIIFLLSLILNACNVPVSTSQPPPLAAIENRPLPTVTNTPVEPTTVSTVVVPASVEPTPATENSAEISQNAPIPDDTWQTIAPGLEHRALPVSGIVGQTVELLYVLRIDQSQYRFDVGYSPGEPKTLPTWLIETDALAVMNASFFTAEYYATGLTIVDGVPSGASYNYGGMVVIRDGRISLQELSAEPYTPDSSIDAGLQAFPLLVNRNGSAAFTEPSVKRARRTAIGEDHNGRILLMIAAQPWLTLTELSHFLADSDLDLSLAFNLDGGPSSGLLLKEPRLDIPSPVLLPTILTIHKR